MQEMKFVLHSSATVLNKCPDRFLEFFDRL